MANNQIFLATIVVVALVGIASADYYRDGHSLKRYQPNEEGYRAGRSEERYNDEENAPSYEAGHSLKPYKPQQKPGATKIQGLIYCRRHKKLVPMQGATARVTCMVNEGSGYETAPFSVETPVTDKKGYFLINLAKYTSPRYTLSNCRVFLDEPAYGDCNIATNTNNGLAGAPLTKYKSRRLSDNSILYSVGPFVFKPSY